MSRNQIKHTGPEQSALPLLAGVFVFGGVKDTPSSFNASRFNSLSGDELYELSAGSVNLKLVMEGLKEISEADEVYVDLSNLEFVFRYTTNEQNVYICRNPVDPPVIEWDQSDPYAAANSLFKQLSGGINFHTEKEMENMRQQHELCSLAADSGWREFISAFAERVAAAEIELRGRTPYLESPYQQIAKHIWPLLEITDWKNGFGEAPDGTKFWLIDVVPMPISENRTGIEANSVVNAKDLEDEYVSYVGDCIKTQKRPSLDEDWNYMKIKHRTITRERVRKLRRQLAPPSWKTPGRPRKLN
jgi:hypothetical protein